MWVVLAVCRGGGVRKNEAFALALGIGLKLTCSCWDRHVHVGPDVFTSDPRCAVLVLCTGAQIGDICPNVFSMLVREGG